jgi:CopG family transcriptional regulator, nickel-responsive regulator
VVVGKLQAALDAVYCLEGFVLRGMSAQVRCIAGYLIGTKGVMHGKIVLTAAGPDLA